jgi:hypothetical protein
MTPRLRLPAVLAVVVLTGAGVGAAIGCGSDKPKPDAQVTCDLYCIPDQGSGSANCPFPTCADPAGECPADCIPVG